MIPSPETEAQWRVFGEHLAALFQGAPALRSERGHAWLAVLTGEQHTDLNQAVLLPHATAKDGEELLALIAAADVPAVISVASEATDSAHTPLEAAGMERAPLSEPLMWCEIRPVPPMSSFDVRPVADACELAIAHRLCALGHGIDEAVVARVLAHGNDGSGCVATWIAWDGDEPISVVWLTLGDSIGVWEMMTPPEHRRRGAARAVLTSALARNWSPSTRGAFLWSSPAGRPLYESLGFRAVDEPAIWFTGGHQAAAEAIGQPI